MSARSGGLRVALIGLAPLLGAGCGPRVVEIGSAPPVGAHVWVAVENAREEPLALRARWNGLTADLGTVARGTSAVRLVGIAAPGARATFVATGADGKVRAILSDVALRDTIRWSIR